MKEEKDICVVVDEDIAHAEAVWDASSYDSDAMFVIMQRYNRPRIIKLMEHTDRKK